MRHDTLITAIPSYQLLPRASKPLPMEYLQTGLSGRRYPGWASLACWLLLGAWGCSNPEGPLPISGYVEAEHVYVAPSRSGWIIRQVIREGDPVAAGDLLFELEHEREDLAIQQALAQEEQTREQLSDSEKGSRPEEIALLKAGLGAAEARLDLARAERQRWEETAARDLASQSQRDAALAEERAAKAGLLEQQQRIEVARLASRENHINAARAALAAASAATGQARWELGQRTVSAGAGGVIDEIYYRTGEYVTAGQPVVSILLDDTRKVRFFLPQQRLSELSLGDNINVRVDGLADPLAARISHIASDAEFTPPVLYGREARAKLVFLIEADLEEGAYLNPGQPVDILW